MVSIKINFEKQICLHLFLLIIHGTNRKISRKTVVALFKNKFILLHYNLNSLYKQQHNICKKLQNTL